MTAESPSINRQRRRFGIGLGVGLGAATAVSSAARAATARVAANTLPSLVKPRALRTGDLVALVALGGVVDDALIEKGVRNLESIGLRVLLAPHLRARPGNFAGTERERLADLHALLEHREVTALWALRGGSGCASLLPHLRYDLIRRQRKIIIGYSDITALTAAVVRHAGLVCFHGPVASSTLSEFSVAHLRALLEKSVGQLTEADELFCHQTTETFANVATSDPAWTERAYGCVIAKDDGFALHWGLGKYVNRNVMDGFAGIAIGRTQRNVRFSRRLAPRPMDMAVGPFRLEVVEPLKATRAILEPTEHQPISFDITERVIDRPWQEDRSVVTRGYRTVQEDMRYVLCTEATGWVEVEGRRIAIEAPGGFGFPARRARARPPPPRPDGRA